MKPTFTLLSFGIFILSTITTNAQISTGTGGGILPNSPTSNTNVGIGTNNPTSTLEVNGEVKAKKGVFTNSLPDGQIFIDANERNVKSNVFSAGNFVSATSRMMNFFDYPTSNINNKSRFWFSIDDRSDNQRFRVYAETGGYGGLEVNDAKQRNAFKVAEENTPDGCNFSHISIPQANTKLIIGSSYENLTPDENAKYKLIVKRGTCGATFLDGSGSALIEGNIVSMGNMSIGTSNFVDGADTYRLSVKGKIRAEEIKVYSTWADYVFSKDYKLPNLKEVEKFINKNGHLPNMPSAKEVTEKGLELGEMVKIQQEKIEELTLYLIQQNKDMEELKAQMKKIIEKK
ncbi:hypothetical protein OIU80_01220 [Flavobacterium sp. LS1R47]|uniref:Cell wall anchor protein n=1 Tax=Flavobacterium frigoritolerans TaxID=2987686 RepID=A0A9X2ZLS0_9FLAO|nr:hypothetical protein [Flavobacterium frigoritolerans]MCV9930891.1 hypothetical protein [Flavobacterium frigoritolerans]